MKFTDFTDDEEKMKDFLVLDKKRFLEMYSYLTEEEYNLTKNKLNKQKQIGGGMKTFNITFVEETKSQVRIKAETLEKAKEIVNSGDFSGDEIIDRDHFEITDACEDEGEDQ
tara:strand:- start:242 stop:577 length:336 start_codon:yes stop_codon:yes gene_type:complete